MADTIYTSQTPASDDSGGVTNRSVGMKFQVSASGKRISSGRYWVPAAGIGTGTLYQIWDGSSKVVEIDLNTVIPSPTLNAWNDVPYPAPFDPAAVHDYVVCAYLDGASHYRFSSGQTLPVGSGGSVSASTAIFGENRGSNLPPNDTTFTTGYYFIDVNVVDASATVNLTPVTIALSAVAMTPTPGMITVNLSPTVITLAPRAMTATPGMVTVNLTPTVFRLTPLGFFGDQPGRFITTVSGPSLRATAPRAGLRATTP